MAKRRKKPRALLLSTQSERSIARVMGALAVSALDLEARWKLRGRAIEVLKHLREVT